MKIHITDKSCRICLKDEGELPLFESRDNSTIACLVASVININISNDVNFPNNICSKCMNNINIAVKLKQDVVNSDFMLKQYGIVKVSSNEASKFDEGAHFFDCDRSESSMSDESDSKSIEEYTPPKVLRTRRPISKTTSRTRKKTFNSLQEFKKCEKCQKKFKTAGNLAQHMRIHLGHKPFECNLCGKQFTKKGSYNIHQRKHTNERPYICEICSKQFMSSGNLQQHMLTHETQRKFLCDACDKTFCHEKGLKAHIVLHSNEKNHICPICEKAFPIKSYLTRHTKTVHNQEKRFKCSECGKAFSNSGNLQAHVRIHTGEKPYECTYCDSKFNQSTPLVRHMQHHKKNDDTLKDSDRGTNIFDNLSLSNSVQNGF